ncbi:MAG: VOC family protein [Bryobacteraceae bacterium]|nr:VOC family protein [Bryobacteraceae bacterium]
MTNFAKDCKSTVIPCLRYRNALSMIDWLCKAFGFETKAAYPGAGNIVSHAELTFGNGMIMLGSVNNGTPYSQMVQQPDEASGKETQTPYLVVSDCDAIYASAKAAGAVMVIDLETKDYGGKAFTCLDPEGHVWSIGSYDPWEVPPATN